MDVVGRLNPVDLLSGYPQGAYFSRRRVRIEIFGRAEDAAVGLEESSRKDLAKFELVLQSLYRATGVQHLHRRHLPGKVLRPDDQDPFANDGARVLRPFVNGDIERRRIRPQIVSGVVADDLESFEVEPVPGLGSEDHPVLHVLGVDVVRIFDK